MCAVRVCVYVCVCGCPTWASLGPLNSAQLGLWNNKDCVADCGIAISSRERLID